MNAIDILREHARLLYSLFGNTSEGLAYLQTKIDEREAAGNTSVAPGYLALSVPNTTGGYRDAAEHIFGVATPPVLYLDELIATHGTEQEVELSEVWAAYQLGLCYLGRPYQSLVPSVVE